MAAPTMDFNAGNSNNRVVEHMISCDNNGKSLDGGKKYKLHLSSHINDVNFWSVIVYDMKERLIISTDQPWPSVHSNKNDLQVNHDGSVDVWFSQGPVEGKPNNWIKTISGKNWYMIFRIYFMPGISFDMGWLPGALEELV